jgi:ribosomal protein S18 acetylase RimI-like enzyme
MKLGNDIIISKGKATYYFKYLEWDTNFFKKTSYVIDLNKSNLVVEESLIEEIKQKLKNSFVTVKLSTSINPDILYFLQQCGFYYIETEVVLETNSKINITNENTVTIIQKEINENLPYQELGENFSLTRFHADINIDNYLADELWVQYLKNYKISNTNLMFTAEVNNEIVGVILVNIDKTQNIATLFYVSVLKEFSGQGIGKNLINYVLNYCKSYTIRTETQIKNIKALNYYISSGLNKINNTYTVLHRW